MKSIYGKTAAVLFVVAGLLPALAGDIVYVKSTGSNTEPYDTEETAATTLNTAVAYANAQGIRKVKVVGTVTQNTQITLENVEVYGDGWGASCLDHTAGYLKPVFNIKTNAFVHGIKFTANNNYTRALYYMTDSSAVISNCCITGVWCATIQSAGEIAGHVTAGLITHCLFSGNHSNNGGGETLKYGLGILGLSGTARMANSVFVGNYHSNNTRGPNDGVLTVADDAVLENCVIYGNYAKSSAGGDAGQTYYRPRNGGGVCVRSGSPTIRNCIVRNNKKPHTPSDGKYPTETTEDIYSATEEGDFYIAPGATPTIENCNTVEGQVPAGAVNCQTGDPLFTDAANGDFHIAAASPCVDAGAFVTFATPQSGTDYYGNARIQGYKIDIGVNEVTKATPMMSVSSSAEIYYDEQDVVFTATSTNAAAPFLPGTVVYVWTVNGVVQAETGEQLTVHVAPAKDYTVTATVNGYFSDTKTIQVKYKPGVEFTSEVTAQKANYSLVDFSAYGVGGFVFDTGAVFKWYRGLHGEAMDAEPFAWGRNPKNQRFDVGTWDIKVVVENADGHGMRLERLRADEVTVRPASVSVAFSPTTGEGRTLIDLSATASNFTFAASADFKWRWATGGEMPEEALATGNPATGTFFPGTWTVQLIVTDADGAGACFTNTIANAVTIADGADYYVSGTGDDASAGTKAYPYKTLEQALAQPAFGTERKTICILGTITQVASVTLTNVEVFAESWTNATWTGQNNSDRPNVTLGENALVHGIKFSSWRVRGGLTLTADTACVSNCWIKSMWFSTAGSPATLASRGLVTHCLYSDCNCNYGPIVTLSGTATMRNSIFTQNRINDGAAQASVGPITVSGTATLANNVIYGNWAAARGDGGQVCAGVYVAGDSPTIYNNIVRNNKINGTLETGTICNYYLAAGTPVVCNNNSDEGFGERAQTGDPKFASLDMTKKPEERDFSISADSPCRNAGLDQPWQKTATDYTGVEPRFQGGRVDIGAYEYPDGVYLSGMVIIFRERSSE